MFSQGLLRRPLYDRLNGLFRYPNFFRRINNSQGGNRFFFTIRWYMNLLVRLSCTIVVTARRRRHQNYSFNRVYFHRVQASTSQGGNLSFVTWHDYQLRDDYHSHAKSRVPSQRLFHFVLLLNPVLNGHRPLDRRVSVGALINPLTFYFHRRVRRRDKRTVYPRCTNRMFITRAISTTTTAINGGSGTFQISIRSRVARRNSTHANCPSYRF